jgi:sulfotransferase 6B1
MKVLTDQLSSKNGFVRKGAAALLTVPKWWRGWSARTDHYYSSPPVLANSIPKSGTHLLFQIVNGLPDRANFGAFLSSMTSSFQFRLRSEQSVARFIRHVAPGEIVRGHLFFDPHCAAQLQERNIVHYFVFRDPRDVVVSGAHYARSMNRWHRLHRYFKNTQSIDEAIKLGIQGLNPPVPGIEFPNIRERYSRYAGWRSDKNCMAIRYEELRSDARGQLVRSMAEFYAARCTKPIDIEACTSSMLAAVAPAKSHTFRSGETSGWRKSFTPEHRRLFQETAGDLLIELGYEKDDSWVDAESEVRNVN